MSVVKTNLTMSAQKAMIELMHTASARVTLDDIRSVQTLMLQEGHEKQRVDTWGSFMRLRIPGADPCKFTPIPKASK